MMSRFIGRWLLMNASASEPTSEPAPIAANIAP